MVLNLNSIQKSYRTNEGRVLVLNGISLKLLAGETLALRGESGSGKSTLLHIAGALELPDAGSVEIAGNDISKMDDSERAAVRRKDIAIIFQQFNLIPSLTVASNINFQAPLATAQNCFSVSTSIRGRASEVFSLPAGTNSPDFVIVSSLKCPTLQPGETLKPAGANLMSSNKSLSSVIFL